MLKRFSIVMAICLCCIVSINADETSERKPNSLTLSGKVNVRAQADRASIVFSVEGEGRSLEQSFGRVRAKIDSVKVKLFGIGLEEKEVATSFFNSNENTGHKAFLSSKRDFITSMTATISTSKLKLLDKIVIILSECKVETISEISFDIIDYEKIRMEALKKAVMKVKEKAVIMTSMLDCSIVEIIDIRENPAYTKTSGLHIRGGRSGNVTYLLDSDASGEFNFCSISPEEIKIESEIHIVFEIKKNTEQVSTP